MRNFYDNSNENIKCNLNAVFNIQSCINLRIVVSFFPIVLQDDTIDVATDALKMFSDPFKKVEFINSEIHKN